MPAPLVVTIVLTPVCVFVIVTFTPATEAPDESITVPLISPVLAFCPRARLPISVISRSKPKRPDLHSPSILLIVAITMAQPPEFNTPRFGGTLFKI